MNVYKCVKRVLGPGNVGQLLRVLTMYEVLGSTASTHMSSVVVYDSNPSRGKLSSSLVAWQV